jgi:hypothetical protein
MVLHETGRRKDVLLRRCFMCVLCFVYVLCKSKTERPDSFLVPTECVQCRKMEPPIFQR